MRCCALANFLGEGMLRQDVGNSDSPTGLQQAGNLVKNELLLLLGDEVDNAVGDYRVRDAVAKWDARYLAFDELSGASTALDLVFLREGEHVLGQKLAAFKVCGEALYFVHIHPNSSTSRADLRRRKEYVEPSTRPKVDNCLALLVKWLAKPQFYIRN